MSSAVTDVHVWRVTRWTWQAQHCPSFPRQLLVDFWTFLSLYASVKLLSCGKCAKVVYVCAGKHVRCTAVARKHQYHPKVDTLHPPEICACTKASVRSLLLCLVQAEEVVFVVVRSLVVIAEKSNLPSTRHLYSHDTAPEMVHEGIVAHEMSACLRHS